MPKLAAKVAAAVEQTEAVKSGFEPISPGKYRATLKEVEERESAAGNDYWNITFHEIYPLRGGDKVPGQQWYTLMMPKGKMPEDYTPKGKEKDPAKAWKIYQDITKGRVKAFFEAFGFTADSDTDELIGEECVIQVGIETQQQGANAGQKRNVVNGVQPLPKNAGSAGGGGGGDDDEF